MTKWSCCFLILYLILIFFPPYIHAAAPEKVAATIDTLARETRKQAEESKAIAEEEQEHYEQKLASLKQRLSTKETELSDVKIELGRLFESKQRLEQELLEKSKDLNTVEGTVRIAASHAKEEIGHSLAMPMYPEWNKTIADMLDTSRYPGVEAVDGLVQVFFDYMQAGSDIVFKPGNYLDNSGSLAHGDILRLGVFTTFYRSPDGDVGFLTLHTGETLTEVSCRPDFGTRKNIKSYMDGERESIAMDISRGAVFARMLAGKDWREWLRAGGFLLWPILAAGFIGLLIGIERLIFLFRTGKESSRFRKEIFQSAERGDWKQCETLLKQSKDTPVIRVRKKILAERGQGQEVLEATLQEAMLAEIPKLERLLSTLQVLAVISPLLGLLGTVTGMINTFQVITVFGTGDPKLMSGGISEALITTQAGLAVAIPLMLIAHFIKKRVADILDDMDGRGTGLIALLLRSREKAERSDA